MASNQMPWCGNCGTQLFPAAPFCQGCGASVAGYNQGQGGHHQGIHRPRIPWPNPHQMPWQPQPHPNPYQMQRNMMNPYSFPQNPHSFQQFQYMVNMGMIRVASPMPVTPQFQPQQQPLTSQCPVTITELPSSGPDRSIPAYSQLEQSGQTSEASPCHDGITPYRGQVLQDGRVNQGKANHPLSPPQQQTYEPPTQDSRSHPPQHYQSCQSQQQLAAANANELQQDSSKEASNASFPEPEIIVIGKDPPQLQGSEQGSCQKVAKFGLSNVVVGSQNPAAETKVMQETCQGQNNPVQSQVMGCDSDKMQQQDSIAQTQLQQVKSDQQENSPNAVSQEATVESSENEGQQHHQTDNVKDQSQGEPGKDSVTNSAQIDQSCNLPHSTQSCPSSNEEQVDIDQDSGVNQNYKPSEQNVPVPEPEIVVIGEDPPEQQGSEQGSFQEGVKNVIGSAAEGSQNPADEPMMIQETCQGQNNPMQSQVMEYDSDQHQDKMQQQDSIAQAQLQQVKSDQNAVSQGAIVEPSQNEEQQNDVHVKGHKEQENDSMIKLAQVDESCNIPPPTQSCPSSNGEQVDMNQDSDVNQNFKPSPQNVHEQNGPGAQNIAADLQVQDAQRSITKPADESDSLKSHEGKTSCQNKVVQDTCKTQQEDNDEVQAKQKIEMELKDLKKQLDHDNKTTTQETQPQDSDQSSEPKYKPVFGPQASADRKVEFAFEVTGQSPKDAKQSAVGVSKSKQSEQEQETGVEGASTQKQKEHGVGSNHQSGDGQNMSSEIGAIKPMTSNGEGDESPPVPLPDQETQKEKNIDGKGNGPSPDNSVTPNNAGESVQSGGDEMHKSKVKDGKTAKSVNVSTSNKPDKESQADEGGDANKTVPTEAATKTIDAGNKTSDAGSQKLVEEGATSSGSSSSQAGKDGGKKKLVELAAEHEGKDVKGQPETADKTKCEDSKTESNKNDLATNVTPSIVYNKKKQEEESFVEGTNKGKKKKGKNKNKGGKHHQHQQEPSAADEGGSPMIPPGLRVSPGQGVQLHFHTIVSPEFNYKPGRDKVVVVMGGVDFGEWKYHCVELKKEKDLSNGYIQISGSANFQISSLKGMPLGYKYQIVKSNKTVLWDYIYKPFGTWNHIMKVPDHLCVNAGHWHQYDDVMQLEIKGKHNQNAGVWKTVTSAWSSVTSTFGFGNAKDDKVSRLVHDRQLAALTFLPKWDGFVVTESPVKMEATEAIQLVHHVNDSVMYPNVARPGSYQADIWEPLGFDGKAFLLKYLSEKIKSLSAGPDTDVIEDVEKRLTSAMAISLLISKHALKPSKQQWHHLFQGMKIPGHLKKQDYIKLVKYLRDTYKTCLQEMINVILDFCNRAIKHDQVERLLLTLPLLHLFRQDVKPYEPAPGKDHFDLEWWGVYGLKLDNGYFYRCDRLSAEFESAFVQLVPLFEVDQMLQRSFVWLQETSSGVLRCVEKQQISVKLACCALNFLLSQGCVVTSNEMEQVYKCMGHLMPQILSINQPNGIAMTPEECQDLVRVVLDINLIVLSSAQLSSCHFVARCCQLFAASHSTCSNAVSDKMTTRSSADILNSIHEHAHEVLNALLNWLHLKLPSVLSHEGKRLLFHDEIKIWHLLLGTTYIYKTEFGSIWKNQLIGYLHDRLDKLTDTSKVELFSNFDTPDLHADVSNCLSDAAFAAIDSLVNQTREKGFLDRLFNSSTSAKYGYLLSKVLLKSWPASEDEETMLQHLLTWAPFTHFFKITANQKTAYGNILNEEAQLKLVLAQSVFDVVLDSVLDGSIIIGRLKLIVNEKCCNQFIALSSIITSMVSDGKGGKAQAHNVKTADIVRLIAARRNELQAIYEQRKLNECLVKMCRKIEPVDCTIVEQSLRGDVQQLQLSKVCQPVTLDNLKKFGKGKLSRPTIEHVHQHPWVSEMLQPLYDVHESRVFGKLWRKQAANLRKAGHSDMLSLSEVATDVWQPAYDKQLHEISDELSKARISLGDIDAFFGDLINNETVLKDELRRVMNFYLQGDANEAIVDNRLRQIKDYYQYKQQSSVAGEMLNIQDAFDLKGDFTPMETLSKVSTEEFKKQPLRSINRDIDAAAREIQTVSKDQIQCLKELAKCKELINWVRTEIKDERQLRVFVELAMNSAGEEAFELDKVTCFHRAVTGYASFIFELKEDAGYKDLLEASKKVWKALETDKNLSKELIDTQRKLYWFRQVRESQGDVETSSLLQAEAINRRGIYTIGKLQPDEGKTEAPFLLLKVDASDEDAKVANDGWTYTIDKLKDLQSKLTLVAGKTKEERTEQNQVDSFVEVFTAAQQIAETYEKLCQAGNILFTDWKAFIYCGYQNSASVHIDFGGSQSNILIGRRPPLTELRYLLEFMNKCLDEWYQYVNDRRSELYHLNYFTTEQLVLLRHCLARFAASDDDEDLPSQVYVLLCAVNQRCTADDIRNAWKSATKDIMKPPTDNAAIAEQQQTVQEAEKREKALEIVHELSEEYGFEEQVAWAAIQDLGLEEEHDVYMDWCVEHVQDDDEIDRLFSELRISEPYLLKGEEPMVEEEEEDVEFKSLPSMRHTLDEMTHDLLTTVATKKKSLEKQLMNLWTEYLKSMKSFDVEDCLSLEHLGLILQHLAATNTNDPPRTFPSSLKAGVPNLVVRSPGDVLKTVLSLYMHEDGYLPSFEEVLVCSPETSLEEVVLLWRRAIGDELGRIFCLVRADLLNYDISVKAEQELAQLMMGETGYHLVIVCSSDKEDNSHIVTALDQYRREMPASRTHDTIQEHLKEQFKMSAQSVEDEEGIETAANLTHHGCNVEVIVSSRPGVGKSLKVKRYTEELMRNEAFDDDRDFCITVPLQEATVDTDAVVKALLPIQDESFSSPPMIYHLDVAPMVREGIDHLLFKLLILGGLCDGHGHVWRCKPQDLYLIEITDFGLQHTRNKVQQGPQLLPFYSVLPYITCHAPQEVLTACLSKEQHETLPQGWQDWDPTVDEEEFSGHVFQRAYQYLVRHSRETNLDLFQFSGNPEGDETNLDLFHFGGNPEGDETNLDLFQFSGNPEGDETNLDLFHFGGNPEGDETNLDLFQFGGNPEGDNESFLTTLLNHCGVEDPSWAELCHFAHFLSIQLDDCQNSVFCNPAFHDLDSGFRGFKTFVVKFMIQMAMDFATPSLNMSEESPSRAVGTNVLEEVYEEEDLPEELEAFQLRRRWETSLHPYIFFNHDRVSMTFMGFYIDRDGSLCDPNTQEIIEASIMNRHLRQALQANGVELSKDFDKLPRWKKLLQLGMVLGVEELIDPDETYELTTDNAKKMLAIHMRFRCGIPVVIMGETGCGKTRLIRFLCRLQAGLATTEEGLNNMILMKVHGGTTSNDISRKIERAQETARKNKEDHGIDTVLFFDEANTTEAIGLIKEIMCDGRVQGKPIDMADGALKIVAACNPYRRHSAAMIERLKAAGLGYHVAADKTQERLGTIPLRELVYRVQALPPSMLPLVWDFGQLNAEIEAKYIRQIVQRFVNTDKLVASPDQAQIITDVLAASQQFMRDQENECSFVSLRDVERCLEVLVWFYDHMDLLRPLMKARVDEQDAAEEEDEEESEDEDEEEEDIDNLTMSLVLAIGVCYHACLQEGRHDYRAAVAEAFDDPCDVPNGAVQILEAITRCQDVFLDQVMNLDDNIARNAALKENVFMMVVCIELRIPLFLVGKPGSSKSLAKTIVADAMQGQAARSSDLFKHLKKVHMASFQCSPLSTADGVVGIFKQCSSLQVNQNLDEFVSVVVLDEVGLAEDSPRMPLKALHPLLETGSAEDEDEPMPYKKVAFIGLSNWALDPAKMNRGILVSREEPDLKELVETARGICNTDPVVYELIEDLIPHLAQAYLTIYKEQQRQYFGLRDYYCLIKMVYQFAKQSGYIPTWAQIVHSVRRNFGGSSNADDQVDVFKRQPILSTLSNMEPRENEPDCSPAGLLRASLDRDGTGQGETRYLLILTENNAALPIVQQQLLHRDAITIFGSSFPYDQEYTEVCRNINRIKVCMETGRTVVLLNLENLYESLYDALNQYYVYFGGQRYVDLGLGTHRVKCRVHEDFRLIVIADTDVVRKKFPTPLINRLEKHFLATSTMLTDAQQRLLTEIETWVQNFASISMFHQHQSRHSFEVSDAFVGYHGDTLASLVFQVCNEIGATDGDQDWRDVVIRRVKTLLLQCATPDSVMRLGESKLLAREVDQIKDDYFNQKHSSLLNYLQHQLLAENQEGTPLETPKDIMAHVTTHSRLLASRDCRQLQETLHIPVNVVFLQNFHTEQQFRTEIKEFLTNCKAQPGLLLIQCDDGHLNNELIACASYAVHDEKLQAKEDSRLNPAHIVFVIQLAMEGKGFTGFRGTGVWSSFHIDDLRPAQPNRPEISSLRGLSIKNLFERDPHVQFPNQVLSDDLMEYAEETVEIAETTRDEAQTVMEDQKDKDATLHQRQQSHNSDDQSQEKSAMFGVAPSKEPSAMDDGEIRPVVIDVTRLLQDSIHSAASRISDSERRAERTTQRILFLIQLLSADTTEGQHPGIPNFLHILKQRLFLLICEREERKGGLVDAWLSAEALRVADVQRSGTFRKAIWNRLIYIVSPLLAELIAYSDCNDNLSLLLEHNNGHWQHQLWLAILADRNVSPLRFEDLLSPVHSVLREKALVRILGSSDKSVAGKLPFSWLLKEFLETMYAQALDLKTLTSGKPVGEIFQNLVIESPWNDLLNHHIPEEVQETFTQHYLMDFIRMAYKTNFGKERVGNELECVYQALNITVQLTRRQLEAPQGSNKLVQLLVAVHLSFAQIQGRLLHFSRLVDLYPVLLDQTNHVEQLMRQEGHMTLDATALNITIESVIPESRCWKDRAYQRKWYARVEAAKPVIEGIIQSIIHGSREVYGEVVLAKVDNSRKMWEKICVLRLFVEHICPVNLEVEEVLSNQGLLLWKTLAKDKNDMKNLKGLGVVENILKMCCTKASKMHFRMGVEDCPLCYKADITQPVELPCGRICCKDCLTRWFHNSNSRGCPACKEQIAQDYPLDVTTENREAIWKYNSFRQRCNAFFMDIISELCFADGTPPSQEVVERLMTYVTRETEEKDKKLMQTKRLTAFQGDGIDPSPVIRSVLLQLLLQSSVSEVQKYMSEYLKQAQDILSKHKTQDIIEVCMLFIQCLEDSCHRQTVQHDNSCQGLVEIATEKLQEAKAWLDKKSPDEDMTIDYLIAIASARFGLVTVAMVLYETYCQQNGGDKLNASRRQVNRLLDEAWELCFTDSNKEAHLFLVRHLCHCYGTNTMETLSQHRTLTWVTPQELVPQNDECPDRFVVCGGSYCSIREAMAQAAVTGQVDTLDKALKGCNQQPARQREVALMLSVFREITVVNGAQEEGHISPETINAIKEFTTSRNSPVKNKEFAKRLIDNQYHSDACNQLVASSEQTIFHQSLVAMVMHTIITFSCAESNPIMNPLVTLLQIPQHMQNSYLPTMPEDSRMEAKKAIDSAANVGETYDWYECPNGHLYTIGDCGRPYYQSQCKECGANIGGASHQLTDGNKKAEMTDTTAFGHVLGEATGRQCRPTSERFLTPLALSIVRVIMHSVMMGAAVTNQQKLENKLATANQALQSDKRFGNNPLMRLLHKHEPSALTGPQDMCNLHTFPDVWQYRPQITVESLLQYLDRQHSGQGEESFALLHEFLQKGVQQLIDSHPEAVGQFLWQHIEADMELMAVSCGKNQDDCLFIVHLVLQRIATRKIQNAALLTWDNLLASKESRAAWEAAFAKEYIEPVTEKLENKLATANQALQSDKRFGNNPLMRLLHKHEPSALTGPQDMCNLHTFPDVWQYRPQITVESLLQYLDRQHSGQGEESFALLHEFLQKDHILSVIHHLPDLIRLQQHLIDRYHRRIDAAEATKMTIQEFMQKAEQDIQQLVLIFINVWNQVREKIPNYGGITVPRDLCSRVLDTLHSIAMLLPTRRQAGVCSTALVDFLIGTHNEMVETYQNIKETTSRSDPIQPHDATLNHLVAYVKDKDLMPLILSHKDYAMEAGQGMSHTFNLSSLQRQIEERFLRGRPKIIHKIEQLVFRQDSHDAVVFQTLRNRIPQKSLSPSIQHQIISQLKSLPDLSDCLAVLVIAIGFLVSSPCQPDMHISKYLHMTLSLPAERGIQASSKAHEYCRLQHLLSLWQTLAVEQARRNNQDPFDDVGQAYRTDLDASQGANLQQKLRHINVDKLIAELYEYIVLNLKRSNNQEQNQADWSIVDVLEAFMSDKYANTDNNEASSDSEIQGLRESFPPDIQLQHAVCTWKAMVDFTNRQIKH